MIDNFDLGVPTVRRIVDSRRRELDRDRKRTKREIAARRDRAGEIEGKMAPEEDGDDARALREPESEIAPLVREREDLKIRRKGVPEMVEAGSLEGKDRLRTVRDNENPFLNLITQVRQLNA